ncbi:hypothetical protein [Aquimarina sp. MMG016]|uniref:hypothetical protein n=1 Tax=Aquimarina sp. MMG016 TaxID=2822690 RepID=UPI001B3A31B5|nr:hypothetical protein [Aquimarina sp. MMG016]MBQ4818861.1 hypothetical protein [Aquimarina sp. MMG016]
MQHSALKILVKALDIPDELRTFLNTNNIDNLESVIIYKIHEIMSMEGFSYRILYQLLDVLNSYDCLDLLEER